MITGWKRKNWRREVRKKSKCSSKITRINESSSISAKAHWSSITHLRRIKIRLNEIVSSPFYSSGCKKLHEPQLVKVDRRLRFLEGVNQ